MRQSVHNNKKLACKTTDTSQQKHGKHEKKKNIWFNPPFSKNISTKIFFIPVISTFPKKPHFQWHIQQKQNQTN